MKDKRLIIIIIMFLFVTITSIIIDKPNNEVEYSSFVDEENIIEVKEIVYDGMSNEELIDKFNRVLKSNLEGKGELFINYSLEMEIDPYIALAISLQETGCFHGNCSDAVKYKNNIGGMMGRSGLMTFNSIDEGIISFINNLAYNYFYMGLNTPELMNRKYAADPFWAVRVNNYVNIIKNA